MYRQILVHSDDRKHQRILWSPSCRQAPDHYELATVTYGLTSAPFLAIRVLHQLAQDEYTRFPLAADIVNRNFYVDDALSGGHSIEDARTKALQIDGLLSAGGFSLQKWATNNASVLTGIEENRKLNIPKTFEDGPILRALGLSWNPVSDAFVFTLHQEHLNASPPTKRSVVSFIARLFDPLGWLAPVVIVAKIFLQTLWKTDLKWDDLLPEALSRRWKEFIHELHHANSFSIPRWTCTSASAILEIHGFSDASQDALAAIVYVRVLNDRHEADTSLLIAKTNVAPLKQITIARLELSAALLLAQLVSGLQRCLNWENVPTHFWTDSSVALAWIRGQPSQWKEFIGNRVAHLQELTRGLAPSQELVAGPRVVISAFYHLAYVHTCPAR